MSRCKGNVRHAMTHPMQVCTETYGAAPDVIIHRGDVADITMPYVDSHLDYMLFELMKNAMRAVVESSRQRRSQNSHGRDDALPPVHVHICKAPTSVTLRISDQVAGAMPLFGMPLVVPCSTLCVPRVPHSFLFPACHIAWAVLVLYQLHMRCRLHGIALVNGGNHKHVACETQEDARCVVLDVPVFIMCLTCGRAAASPRISWTGSSSTASRPCSWTRLTPPCAPLHPSHLYLDTQDCTQLYVGGLMYAEQYATTAAFTLPLEAHCCCRIPRRCSQECLLYYCLLAVLSTWCWADEPAARRFMERHGAAPGDAGRALAHGRPGLWPAHVAAVRALLWSARKSMAGLHTLQHACLHVVLHTFGDHNLAWRHSLHALPVLASARTVSRHVKLPHAHARVPFFAKESTQWTVAAVGVWRWCFSPLKYACMDAYCSIPFLTAGGDLKLVSMEGFGVDAYLSIQHLEGVWQEQQVEAEVPEQETAGKSAAHAAPQLSHG